MSIGVINVLKPPGMTSHDVVSFIRRTYGIKRVGHAGTLDPAAAGVLPVCVGQATRLVEYMTDCDKAYRVELTFGYATDTGDDTGNILTSTDVTMPSPETILAVLKSLIGNIEQLPPMYSAIKIAGKKLYEYARQGITVERKPRNITIHDISLIKIKDHSLVFDVVCSKGTYIRTLCTDIGDKIGYPAVMSFLIRTRVGNFKLEDAWTLEEIIKNKENALLKADRFLSHLPLLKLTFEQAEDFVHGRPLECNVSVSDIIRIYDEDNRFLGIGQKPFGSSLLAPIKVMSMLAEKTT